MVDRSRAALGKAAEVMQSARFVLIAVAVTVVLASTSIVLSYQANNKATAATERVANEANERAKLAVEQSEKFKFALCGLTQPIAASPLPPQNERAAQFQESAVLSAKTVDCSPDPFDNR